jgi:hypothetical protein
MRVQGHSCTSHPGGRDHIHPRYRNLEIQRTQVRKIKKWPGNISAHQNQRRFPDFAGGIGETGFLAQTPLPDPDSWVQFLIRKPVEAKTNK